MSSDNHYPNAPITEAVIDIQVNAAVSLDALERINADETNYLTADKLNATSGVLMFAPDKDPVSNVRSQVVGYLYRGVDGLHIYQARTNGFTLSRLAPYPRWGEFCTEAHRLWEKYRHISQPSAITRVAVRYVNRIDIPLPLDNFDRYLRTSPQLSSDLPQGLSGYFMQLMFPIPEISGSGIINEAIIEPSKPDVVSVVLDIDVFRSVDLPQTEDGLWKLLEALRRAKNKVFEACITDETRKLFQ